MHNPAWEVITTSQVVVRGPVEIIGIMVNASTAAASADLYDQADPVTNELVWKAKASTVGTNVISLPYPIVCKRGLYVVVNSNVDEVGIQYRPVEVG